MDFGNQTTQPQLEGYLLSETALFYWAQLKIRDIMNCNVVALAPEQTMQEAAWVMDKEGITCVLVRSEKQLVGILQQKDVIASIQAGKDSTHTPIKDWMSKVVKTVDPTTPVLYASELMEKVRLKHLPVISDEGLVGIVTQADIVQAFESMSGLRSVTEVMSTRIVSVSADQFVSDAIDMMMQKGISCVLVVRREKADGILTEKDILRVVVEQGKDPKQTRVVEVMSLPVITVPPTHSVLSTSRLMHDKHLHRMVVVDDSGPLGIVTRTDIIKGCQAYAQQEIQKSLHMLYTTDEATILLNKDGVATYVNPAFMKLFSSDSPGHFVNRPFPPEELWVDVQDKEPFVKCRQTHEGGGQRLTLHKIKGGYVSLNLCFNDIKDRTGRVIGQHGIAWDISHDGI